MMQQNRDTVKWLQLSEKESGKQMVQRCASFKLHFFVFTLLKGFVINQGIFLMVEYTPILLWHFALYATYLHVWNLGRK